MKTSVEPPCKAKQEDKEHEEGKGCAVLVEGRHIADLDSRGAGCLHLDSVGVDDLLFSPFGVPFLQIDSVGTDADKDAVMQIDAVALDVGGELLTVVSRCQTAHR